MQNPNNTSLPEHTRTHG